MSKRKLTLLATALSTLGVLVAFGGCGSPYARAPGAASFGSHPGLGVVDTAVRAGNAGVDTGIRRQGEQDARDATRASAGPAASSVHVCSSASETCDGMPDFSTCTSYGVAGVCLPMADRCVCSTYVSSGASTRL